MGGNGGQIRVEQFLRRWEISINVYFIAMLYHSHLYLFSHLLVAYCVERSTEGVSQNDVVCQSTPFWVVGTAPGNIGLLLI